MLPDVYVVPPEEDESPPWCFFDAGLLPAQVVVEEEEEEDYDDRGPNDSDVVEVVKVRRRPLTPESVDAPRPRRSLRSRASKVFRSLRGPFRSKPDPSFDPPESLRRASLYDVDPAALDDARLNAASPAPSTASKSSVRNRLSKLFSFSSSSSPSSPPAPSRPSLDSLTNTPASSTSGPQTPTSPDPPPLAEVDPPVFGSAFNTDSPLNLGLGLELNDDPEDDHDPTPQPTPSNRRSISSITSSLSRWSSMTSLRRHPTKSSNPPLPQLDDVDDPDMSLEIRLDSLHFDDLSFDPDHFSTS